MRRETLLARIQGKDTVTALERCQMYIWQGFKNSCERAYEHNCNHGRKGDRRPLTILVFLVTHVRSFLDGSAGQIVLVMARSITRPLAQTTGRLITITDALGGSIVAYLCAIGKSQSVSQGLFSFSMVPKNDIFITVWMDG